MLAYVQLCNVHARRGILLHLKYRYQNVCPIVFNGWGSGGDQITTIG